MTSKPLTVLLGIITLAVAVATLAAPGLLLGPDAMNGSARGTALVMLLVGLPAYAVAAAHTGEGSFRADIVLTGLTAYLLYNAVMFVFATPFNRLFLLYVAMLGLAIAALLVRSLEVWRRSTAAMTTPPRWVIGYALVVATLNLLVWLASILPAVLGDDPQSVLDGTGVATNPVYVQDLAFWLPAMAWLAIGAWHGHLARAALLSAGLVMWVAEGLGVAADQWWAHQADPSSAVASAGAVPLFVAIAAAALIPTVVVLRPVR